MTHTETILQNLVSILQSTHNRRNSNKYNNSSNENEKVLDKYFTYT